MAQLPPEPGKVPMHKSQVLIEVGSYQESSNTYEIIDVKLRGQGPFYATMDDLVKSVPSLKMDRLKKNPQSIVSNQYQIDVPLRLLAPMEIEQLSKKKQKKR